MTRERTRQLIEATATEIIDKIETALPSLDAASLKTIRFEVVSGLYAHELMRETIDRINPSP